MTFLCFQVKANPPGTSKILARARRKAMEEVEKKVRMPLYLKQFLFSILKPH